MRIPVLHALPRATCLSLSCLPHELEQPLVERIPVLDDAGIHYTDDFRFTESLYLCIFAYFAVRGALRYAMQLYVSSREDDDEA